MAGTPWITPILLALSLSGCAANTGVLRGSITVPEAKGIDKVLENIRQTFDVVAEKDRRKPGPDGYTDVLLNVKRPDGSIGELQVMTDHVYNVKNGVAHKWLEERQEIARQIEKERREPTPAEREKMDDLNRQMRKAYEATPEREVSIRSSNSSAEMRAPLRMAESRLNQRGSIESNALVPPGRESATGIPSTSKKEDPLGRVAETEREPDLRAMEGYPPTGNIPENVHAVYTPTGRRVHVQSKIIEADELVTSDKEGYPQELQPRQRGTRVAMNEQVRQMAAKLNPELLGASADASGGAPIVAPNRVVESGNGRVMAIREAYANHPERAEAYRQYLQKLGFTTDSFDRPVRVRERVTPLTEEERRAFTVEANQSSTSALSATERAVADSRLIDEDLLNHLKEGELHARQNGPFVGQFLERLPQSERNALLGPDGKLSAEGARRIQGAILAKAYGGAAESQAVLERMLESTDNDAKASSTSSSEQLRVQISQRW